LLAELDSQAEVHRAAAAINARRVDGPAGIRDVIPGARTVLVTVEEESLTAVRTWVAGLDLPAPEPAPLDEAVLEIPVRYDGPDLDRVAEQLGTSVAGVVQRHTRAVHTVAFCGFAAGFAYIEGLPADLHLPRLATPRTQVPSGAVAIAGPYTGIYPRPSPGGWNLIGRTELEIWNTAADPPSPLWAGRPVRFVAGDG
jgi:KipI family sensor histidine kinase inhibitor